MTHAEWLEHIYSLDYTEEAERKRQLVIQRERRITVHLLCTTCLKLETTTYGALMDACAVSGNARQCPDCKGWPRMMHIQGMWISYIPDLELPTVTKFISENSKLFGDSQ